MVMEMMPRKIWGKRNNCKWLISDDSGWEPQILPQGQPWVSVGHVYSTALEINQESLQSIWSN